MIYKNAHIKGKTFHRFKNPFPNITGDIFVDFVNGSDNNDGASAGTPVKSFYHATTICPDNGTISVLPKQYTITSNTVVYPVGDGANGFWDIFNNQGKTLNINGNSCFLDLTWNNYREIFGTLSGSNTVNLSNFNLLATSNANQSSIINSFIFDYGGYTTYNLDNCKVYLDITYPSTHQTFILYTNVNTQINVTNSELYMYDATYTSDMYLTRNGFNQSQITFDSNTIVNTVNKYANGYTGTPTVQKVPTVSAFKTSIGY